MLVSSSVPRSPVGLTFRGGVFEPVADDEVCCVVELENCSVGVQYDATGLFWRLLPSLRVPPRFSEDVEKWLFDNEDERLLAVKVDVDGEVIVKMKRPWTKRRSDEVLAELDEKLAFVDECVVPALSTFVAEKIAAEKSAKQVRASEEASSHDGDDESDDGVDFESFARMLEALR